MKDLQLQSLQLYLHCPVRWLFEEYYKVDVKAKPEELYSAAINSIVVGSNDGWPGLFAKILTGGLDFAELSSRWSTAWQALATKAGIDIEKSQVFEKKGLLTLLKLFDILKNIVVLGVHIPWESKWEIFDTRLVGTCPAIIQGSLIPGDDNDSVYAVAVIPPNACWRNCKTSLQVFGLAHAAFNKQIPTQEARTKLRTIILDLDDCSLELLDKLPYNEFSTTIGIAVNQIFYTLCLPHAANHCRVCPYSNICRPNILSKRALGDIAGTKKVLEWILTADNS